MYEPTKQPSIHFSFVKKLHFPSLGNDHDYLPHYMYTYDHFVNLIYAMLLSTFFFHLQLK